MADIKVAMISSTLRDLSEHRDSVAEKLSAWFQALKRDFADLPRFESEIEHLRAWQEHVYELAPKLASRLVWLQAYPPFHRGHYQGRSEILKLVLSALDSVNVLNNSH